MITNKTLLEQMRINEIEIFHRMKLLDLSSEDLDAISSQKKVIEQEIESIVEDFYNHQTQFEEISLVIGDSETMRRLRTAQRQYILELFSGYYDSEYVNSRLRIGLVHKRIGVEPKLFLSGVRTLKFILFRTLEKKINDRRTVEIVQNALDKLIYFDITLVFDTYIDTLLGEVESAKRRMESYAYVLEEKTKTLGNYAERDPLTELYNKRGMMKIIKNELRMAQRRHTLLSLIYIDVNKFKNINDNFGHARGDETLKELANCIRKNIRSSDHPCRVGGDEFCIILPDCDYASASMIAEQIATEFASYNTEFSISTGVSETGTQEYINEESLIKIADENMYIDKAKSYSKEGGEKKGAGEQKKITSSSEKSEVIEN